MKKTTAPPAKSGNKQKNHRFQKGQSGNPKGRPAGSRNKATIILENMLQGQAEELMETAIKTALQGDGQMIRALLDKLLPNRKDAPVKIRLPTVLAAKELPVITAAILRAVSSGRVTPSEAAALCKIVDSHKSAVEICEIEARLNKLEIEVKRGKK